MAQNILDNQTEFTVGELSSLLKKRLEGEFSYIRIRGEISNFTRAASGHIYFSLKDDRAVLDAVCWRGTALTTEPEDGLEIIATGRITTYMKRSRYQLVVEKIDIAGVGALLKLLETRRKAFEQEGLFAAERKKPLPFLPRLLGVVTSSNGAVIHDILHRVKERFPMHVLIWPVKVQGKEASAEIAHALEGFNMMPSELKPDVIILARGGGSLEDLWAFNEEVTVRAIVASDIPIISAIGHETDTSLSDYVADLCVPTPTAAAEKAVPVRHHIEEKIQKLGEACKMSLLQKIERAYDDLRHAKRMTTDTKNKFLNATQRHDAFKDRLFLSKNRFFEHRKALLDGRTQRLPRALENFVKHRQHSFERTALGGIKFIHAHLIQLTEKNQRETKRLWERATYLTHTKAKAEKTRWQSVSDLLESFSFHNVMKRGFALIRDRSHQLVFSARPIKDKQELSVFFGDDTQLTVTAMKEREAKKPHPSTLKTREQKGLFDGR